MNTSDRISHLPASGEEYSSLAAEAVDAIEDLSGVHPGYRRAHAKGICCRAFFRPSGLGMEFTTAAHLQEQQVDAVVRFSAAPPIRRWRTFSRPPKEWRSSLACRMEGLPIWSE